MMTLKGMKDRIDTDTLKHDVIYIYILYYWHKVSFDAANAMRYNQSINIYIDRYNLVGGFNPSEKYWSEWIIIPTIGENKKCSKSPTSRGFK